MNSSWKECSKSPPIFELMLEVLVIHGAAWRTEWKRNIFQLKHSVSKSQKRGKNAKLSFSISLKICFLSFLLGLRKRKMAKERYKVYAKIKTAFKNELVLYSKGIWITNQNRHNLSVKAHWHSVRNSLPSSVEWKKSF